MLLEGHPDNAEHRQGHFQLPNKLSSLIKMFSIGGTDQESGQLIAFLTN